MENEMKIAIIEGIGSLTINSQPKIYIHNPNKREPKQNVQYHESLTNQHTKAILSLIIPQTTYHKDKVMLHRFGIKG